MSSNISAVKRWYQIAPYYLRKHQKRRGHMCKNTIFYDHKKTGMALWRRSGFLL